MHGPENKHLKKECAGLYVSIVCQCFIEDEGLHNGDCWRPNGQFGIKVPADADGIGGAQNPMRHTPWHDAGKSFSSIVCNLNCTYSISPFWRWTPSKQYWSVLFPLFTKYGSHLGPRELMEQTISCSPNHIIKIQYLLPFKTTIKVPRPSESVWSGLMVPLLLIRDYSIWGFMSGMLNTVSYWVGTCDWATSWDATLPNWGGI